MCPFEKNIIGAGFSPTHLKNMRTSNWAKIFPHLRDKHKKYLGVSKNRDTPKWMVKIMENPIKMDDLGGKTHYFRKHPIWSWHHPAWHAVIHSDSVTSPLIMMCRPRCSCRQGLLLAWLEPPRWADEGNQVRWPMKNSWVIPGIPTTIKTLGVNTTTIAYLRVLIIEIGSWVMSCFFVRDC